MKRAAVLPFLLFALACGTDSTAPPAQVEQILTEIDLYPPSLDFGSLGQTKGFRATPRDQRGLTIHGIDLSWTSSHPDLATVGGAETHAVVTSVGNGTAFITVASGEVSATLPVIVRQVPQEVLVTPETTGPLWFPLSVELTAVVTDLNGNVCDQSWCAVTWSSEDPGIAAVDQTGTVTPVEVGTAEITAAVLMCFNTCTTLARGSAKVIVSPM